MRCLHLIGKTVTLDGKGKKPRQSQSLRNVIIGNQEMNDKNNPFQNQELLSIYVTIESRMETRRLMPSSAIASHPANVPYSVVHARSHVQHSCCEPACKQYAKRSQTTTTATTLSSGAVGWSWSNVLDTADLHAGTGESAKGGLGTWARGLGAVT